MKAIFALLFTTLLFVIGTKKEQYYGVNVMAFTLAEASIVPSDGEWHLTGLCHTIQKHADDSTLKYSVQLTIQQNATALIGNHFRVRVKDSSGVYIMPDMESGQGTQQGFTRYNVAMTDSVYHQGAQGNPPRGFYTIEVDAFTGAGELMIVPFMSNLVVEEVPPMRMED